MDLYSLNSRAAADPFPFDTTMAQALALSMERGLTAAANAEMASFVTETAMMATARLSVSEELCSSLSPWSRDRYRMLVDTFAMVAAQCIWQAGR